MTGKVHISAVIPTYNRKATIVRAIESVLAQEYPVSEIIIVDDGSNDGTIEIVNGYRPLIRYLFQDNAGISVARNRGVNEAGCEWVAFLDSDDYWLPQHTKRIKDAILETSGKAALYFSNSEFWVDNGMKFYWDLCGLNINAQYEYKENAFEWALMKRQPMLLQVSAICREKYIRIGGLPEQLVTREDTFIFYLLCLLFPICAVSGCGAVISSDCNQSGRLTVTYDSSTEIFYECTKRLYIELMKHKNKMTYDQLKIIEGRLVQSFFSSGIFYAKRKNITKALYNVLYGAMTSPHVFAHLIRKKLLKHYNTMEKTNSAKGNKI